MKIQGWERANEANFDATEIFDDALTEVFKCDDLTEILKSSSKISIASIFTTNLLAPNLGFKKFSIESSHGIHICSHWLAPANGLTSALSTSAMVVGPHWWRRLRRQPLFKMSECQSTYISLASKWNWTFGRIFLLFSHF